MTANRSTAKAPQSPPTGFDHLQRACAAWSVITEPGDEFGGYLRAALGVEASLLAVQNLQANQIFEDINQTGWVEVGTRRFGDVRRVLNDALERYKPRLQPANIDLALATLVRANGWLVTPFDSDWPSSLNDLAFAAPAVLWGSGQRAKLAELVRAISIVGSRGASPYGEWVTVEFVAELVGGAFSIVSGGAYGIDGVAHRAALRSNGTTIAVMAGGIDRLYPAGHQSLFNQICESGAIISELAPGSSPTKWRFLQRNRLIAALGKATLIVEAGSRSGSINTANHATALGRPIAAVPGPITATSSAGTNRLIKDGIAQLVTTAGDIAELAGEGDYLSWQEDAREMGSLELRALDALTVKPATGTEIAKRAGLSAQELAIALGQLLLLGRIGEVDGRYFKVKQTTL